LALVQSLSGEYKVSQCTQGDISEQPCTSFCCPCFCGYLGYYHFKAFRIW